MAAPSPHGLLFAGIQLVIVLGLWWLGGRWHAKGWRGGANEWTTPIVLSVLLVAWYALLRVQPYRMSGTWFEYTLGIFDGLTLLGLIGLFWLHHLRRRQTRRATA